MKKLVLLALVLAMASIAGADLTWSVDTLTLQVAESQTIQIVSSDTGSYTSVWVGADPSPTGVAKITGMTMLPAAAEGGYLDDGPTPGGTGYEGWWQIEAVDFNPPSDILAGPHFDVTILGMAVGTYVIGTDEYGGAGANDYLTINVVPEPMTLGLLGLGGLFLRRRK